MAAGCRTLAAQGVQPLSPVRERPSKSLAPPSHERLLACARACVLAQGGDGTRPPRRFLPFSTGLRSCIGQNLAKMNYTATLAVLLSRFSFELREEVSVGTSAEFS